MDNYQALRRALRDQGWTIRRRRNSHWAVIPPSGGRAYTLPCSASDARSWPNAIAELRRAGLVWPHRKSARKSNRDTTNIA